MEKVIQTFWGLLRIERHIVYSKGVINETWNIPLCSQGGWARKGQQIPTGPLSSGLHSAERVSAGIDYP